MFLYFHGWSTTRKWVRLAFYVMICGLMNISDYLQVGSNFGCMFSRAEKRDESFVEGSWNFRRRSRRTENRNFAAAEHSGRIKYRLRPENFPPRYSDYDEERGSERRGGGPRLPSSRQEIACTSRAQTHYVTADFNWIRAARVLPNLLPLGDNLAI